MTDPDAAAPPLTEAVSLELQQLALALRALAATARGQLEVAEETMHTLAAHAALITAPLPRTSVPPRALLPPRVPASRGSFLSWEDWR